MKRHPIDTTSLVAGLLFLAVAGLAALRSLADVDLDGGLVVPIVLIAVGLIGLGAALPRPRRTGTDSAQDDRAADPAADSADSAPDSSAGEPGDDPNSRNSGAHDTVIVERPDR